MHGKQKKDLENGLTLSKQYSRKNNLEIQGVTEAEDEAIVAMLAKIADAVKEQMSETEIEICHSVPTRSSQKANMIVQSCSRVKRDNILKKVKKNKLTNKDIDFDTSHPIYVSKRRCPTLKKLLAMTIKKKYERELKSVWVSNGKIFAKQAEGTPPIQILAESDIDVIFSSQANVTIVSSNAE